MTGVAIVLRHDDMIVMVANQHQIVADRNRGPGNGNQRREIVGDAPGLRRDMAVNRRKTPGRTA
jgi:hypothetical protein